MRTDALRIKPNDLLPLDPTSALALAFGGGHEAIIQMLTTASFCTWSIEEWSGTTTKYIRPIYSMPIQLREKGKRQMMTC